MLKRYLAGGLLLSQLCYGHQAAIAQIIRSSDTQGSATASSSATPVPDPTTWDRTPGENEAWVEGPPPDMPSNWTPGYNVWRAVPENASLGRNIKFGDLSNTYLPDGSQYFRDRNRSIDELLKSQGSSAAQAQVGDSSYTQSITLGEIVQANGGELPQGVQKALVDDYQENRRSSGQDLTTLQQSGALGGNLAKVFSDNPIVKEIPLSELASGNFRGALDVGVQRGAQEAVKNLPANWKDLPVGAIAGSLFSGDYRSALREGLNYGGKRLGEYILKSGALKNLPVGAIAKDLPISELGNIASNPLSTLPRIGSQYISKIPGLKNASVVQNGVMGVIAIAKGDIAVELDVAYAGPKENPAKRAYTGGTPNDTFTPAPCIINSPKKKKGKTHNCAGFEMGKKVGGVNPWEHKGKVMVDGTNQWEKGGKGFLKNVNGGWEPTGWKPFAGSSQPAKLSLKNIKEKPGTNKPAEASIQVDLQIVVKVWGKTHKTPHFIPVPTAFKAIQGKTVPLLFSGSLPAEVQKAIDSVQGSPAECDLQRQAESGSVSETSGTPTTTSNLTTKNSAKSNQAQYLARIAAGESSGGTNLGAVPGSGSDAPYGEYQFRGSTRNAVLAKYPELDAWSSNKATRDKAALAWIGMYGNEIGVDLLGAIQKGDFTTADRALGKNQFTSLPGGSEESPVWKSSANLKTYGSVEGGGSAPTSESGDPCARGGVTGAGGIPGTGKGSGEFLFPVNQGINSPYGYRSSTGTFHGGVDLFVEMNTPVKASRGGVVIDSENGCAAVGSYGSSCGGGYGNLIQVRHDDGSTTMYAHNSRTLFKPGDRVDQGQVIAYSGSSGSSMGPHVHFEIRNAQGERVNPAQYLYGN